MKFLPILSVRSYTEMLQKLTLYQVFTAFLCIYILRHNTSELDGLFLSVERLVTSAVGDYKLLSLAPAIMLAIILGHIVKLHDRLSDIFRIRKTFDLLHIIYPMALGVGVMVPRQKLPALEKDRHGLMQEVFYRYASSTVENPVVSKHEIHQALTQWSWYWVLIEVVFYLFFTALALFAFRATGAAAYTLILVFILTVASDFLKRESEKYARAQVRQILEAPDRRDAIKAVFDAL